MEQLIEKGIDSISQNEEQPTPQLESVRNYWLNGDVSKRIKQYENINVEEAYRCFLNATHPKVFKRNLWKAVAAIAATVVLAFLVAHFYDHSQEPSDEVKIMLAKKIPVLSDSLPQLKLGNGQVISLNHPNTRINQSGIQALVGNSCIAINTDEDAPVEMVELSIPRGCQYQVVLPDGSTVNLNSGSKLRFPSVFKKERHVELVGEAYFSVQKDGRTFQVTCPTGTIQVLGTTFNVKSFGSKQASVTLYTGKVAYRSQGHYVLMKPGEKLTQQGNDISVITITDQKDKSWKEGIISFDDESLQDVMADIERIYDVEVKYDCDVSDLRFSGVCKRSQSVDNVMKILGLTEEFEYEIVGKTIIIK